MSTDQSFEFDPYSIEGVAGLIERAMPAPGVIDIWCIEIDNWPKFAAAFSAVMLRATQGDERTPMLKRVVFAITADFERTHNFSSSLTTELVGLLQTRGLGLDLAQAWARGATVAIAAPNSRALVEIFKGLGSRTLVVVLNSIVFTSDNVPDDEPKDRALRESDLWVPGFVRASGEIDAVLKSAGMMFGIAVTGRITPMSSSTRELLSSISGGVLMTSASEQHEKTVLVVERALGLAKSGAKQEALATIDTAGLGDFDSALVKAQILVATNDAPLAFTYLEPHVDQILASGQNFSLMILAKAARWHDASISERAINSIVASADPSLLVLISALDLASKMEADGLEGAVLRELIRRFPASEIGLRSKIVPLLESGGFDEALSTLQGDQSPTGQYLTRLAHAISSPGTDWTIFLDAIRKEGLISEAFATVDIVRLLLDRTELVAAAKLILGCKWDKLREKVALSLARRLLLALVAKDDVSRLFIETLRWSIRTTATRPDDQASRAALSRFLATDSVGLTGTLFLIAELLQSGSFESFAEESEPKPMAIDDVKRLLDTEDPKAIGLLGSRSVKMEPSLAPAACESIVTILEHLGEAGEDNERAIMVFWRSGSLDFQSQFRRVSAAHHTAHDGRRAMRLSCLSVRS